MSKLCIFSDALTSRLSERDCIEWYFRLQRVCGTQNTPASMDMTYDDFKTGLFMMAFDLSHQKMAYDTSMRPITTSKVLSLNIKFSDGMPDDIRLMAVMEYASTVKVTYERKIFTSFTP